MKKDYYEVLEVDKKSTKHDIKKQYKHLAKLYHPDKETDETKKSENEEKFKEINEAYSILSDDNKRKQYDEFGFDLGKTNTPNEDDLHDFFNSFVRNGGFGGQQQQRGPSQLKNSINLTLNELYTGVTKKFTYNVNRLCNDCKGEKFKPEDGGKIEDCKHCNGTGQKVERRGNMMFSTTCNSCHGTGKVIVNGCKKCNSTGLEIINETIEITIPKGLPNNGYIIYNGKGNEMLIDGKSVIGDLVVFITETQDAKFARNGNDLHCVVGVDIFDCIIGENITVDTIDGKTHKFKLNVGTESGYKYRLNGKGMPIMNATTFGDLYVHVKHIMPTEITDIQKELIQKLKTNK